MGEFHMKEAWKEMTNPNTDCIPCRILSSGMLLFSGIFLMQHRNNFGKVNAVFQTSLGMGKLIIFIIII